MRCACYLASAVLSLALLPLVRADVPQIAPPVAKIVPHVTTLHGQQRSDDYFWLREKNNPEVIQYLEAENSYVAARLGHTTDLQAKLYEEMKGRIKEADLTVPARIDDYYYYTRTETGRQYRVHCRKKGNLDAKEEVLLDENAMAEGKAYFRLGEFEVSPNHQLVAYSIDLNGSEEYTLRVRDLAAGADLPDELLNVAGTAWASDNTTFFYVTLDAAKRPYKAFRHKLGATQADDALVHHEADERFFVSVGRSRSERFVFLDCDSKTTSESRFVAADAPTAEFRMIQPRVQDLEYSVEDHGDDFYIVTNADGATNFKIVRAPIASPEKSHWADFAPYNAAVKIDGLDAFKDHMVIRERQGGTRHLRVHTFATNESARIEFPESVYTVFAGENPEFDTATFRFNSQSMTTPSSVFDYDVKTGKRELKKKTEVLGGYDESQYVAERIYATAPDGVRVPISLVYRKGLQRNGANPTLLYGYGSYGAPMDPTFASNRVSLLDRGFVYAIAHIRGGGEMGRTWYDDGKLMKKRNTFTDFIACAEKLIEQKFTRPEKLAIQGGSAGGLLMGAVTNMRPDLFKCVVAQVPFVDCVNTMLDASLPLTVTEYEEWGNPNDPAAYDYMMTYSPYENVEAKDYPAILALAGLNDPRVSYWEPAKWIAKLRKLRSDTDLTLLKTNMGAGHGGASGRFDRLREVALEYAFILDQLGATTAAAN